MQENNANVEIKDVYGNKISFIGETQVIPIKFMRVTAQTLSAETRESFLDRADRLTISVNKLSKSEYETLIEIFYSTGKKTIKTEKGEIFKMIFNMEELSFNYNYDENGIIFYYGTLEMVS